MFSEVNTNNGFVNIEPFIALRENIFIYTYSYLHIQYNFKSWKQLILVDCIFYEIEKFLQKRKQISVVSSDSPKAPLISVRVGI